MTEINPRFEDGERVCSGADCQEYRTLSVDSEFDVCICSADIENKEVFPGEPCIPMSEINPTNINAERDEARRWRCEREASDLYMEGVEKSSGDVAREHGWGCYDHIAEGGKKGAKMKTKLNEKKPADLNLEFSTKELVTMMIKARGLHEGIWSIITHSLYDRACVIWPDGIERNTICRAVHYFSIKEEPYYNPNAVDAAVVNPRAK